MAQDPTPKQEDFSDDIPQPKNHLVSLLLILNFLILGGVIFLQFQAFQKQKNTPLVSDLVKAELEAEKKRQESLEKPTLTQPEGKLFPLQAFTSNLAQSEGGPRRYVRLEAVLKFNQEAKDEELKSKTPRMRDSIITLLNSKRPEDLMSVEGKSFLKEEIKSSINTFLQDGKVIDIYYVGFQVN